MPGTPPGILLPSKSIFPGVTSTDGLVIEFAVESRFIIHDTGALHAIRRYIADWEMHPCDFFNNHGRIVPSSGLTHHLFPFHVVHRQEAISCQEVADDTIASA